MDCHKCQGSCQGGQKTGWLLKLFSNKDGPATPGSKLPQLALVGMPNVGKSVLFNALTGTYATVSNYPGTTVEVSRGVFRTAETELAVVDTPGMYSLLPITEEEKVARDLLLKEPIALALHVVDGKNLGRMLPLTFQLIEASLPVMLAVNMMDEAQQLGIDIKGDYLEKELGIPVVTLAAAHNVGLRELKSRVAAYVESGNLSRAN
nr:FeoB small GTPase domain-containing protein [[Phormidium] sp. ETS-05]